MKKDFDNMNRQLVDVGCFSVFAAVGNDIAALPVGNEITALADGDFGDSRIQPASESGFVIPSGSIANWSFVSSVLNDLVDNLKPAEGIEPSSQRMTNPDSLQAAGYQPLYTMDSTGSSQATP
ncbi:MAG: hypothetical protein Q7R58_02500 [bacterium]|nr:hypothetical protein [bacterium]